jgi:hypothetical protein
MCFKLLQVCQINIFLSDLLHVCVAKPNSDIHICIFLIPVSDVIFGCAQVILLGKKYYFTVCSLANFCMNALLTSARFSQEGLTTGHKCMRVLAAGSRVKPALFTQLASKLTTTARLGSLHADAAVFLAKCFASTTF